MIEQYKETAIDTTQVYRMDKSVRQGGGLVGQLYIEFNNGRDVVFEAVTEEDLQELEFIYYRFVRKYGVTEKSRNAVGGSSQISKRRKSKGKNRRK